MRLLLTGFRPFGGLRINPSWEAIRHLGGGRRGAFELHVAELPVSYRDAPRELCEHVARVGPAAIVLLGVATERACVSLERTARNQSGAAVDEDGVARPGPIEPGAPPALPSALPLAEIHAALARERLPVEWSDDAGGYLCNRVFWEARRHLAPPSGFVHLPPPEALSLELQRRAVELMIVELVAALAPG
ncbi:MAG: hypothetical protein IT376_23435 [Polyangiaceae bacterium]|nr:hypothetical protein [Polyangiaceae bacterium]